ncbi:sodium:calcium antiporter [Candidatus Woesearchaeota archaeon]|nr:sodium:calcium antiporter [Candidatus Woesearchaeota archaeon]
MAIAEVIYGNPKMFLAIIIIVSLAILVKSADMLLYGVTRYFRRIGLSDYLTGLVVVAAVASFPELISAITGASLGDHGVVFGTILGSNVGGLTLILGIMSMVGKRINIQSKLFNKVRPIVFIFTLLPLFLVLIDGTLSRIDGAILIAAYAIYLIFVWHKESEAGELHRVKLQFIWKDGMIFLLALAALLLSARWLIFGVIELSKRLEISSFIVAVVILGVGAQMPDLIVIIRSASQGHKDVGMGDLLGSTITKQLMFMGLIAVFVPLSISFSVIWVAAVALASTMGVVLLLMGKGWITWKHGIALFVFYVMYLIAEVINATK